MEKRKLRVGFCFFPYGGNGGISSEVPTVRNWIVSTVIAAKSDDRIHDIVHQDFSDTPITMTRNRAVLWGREQEVDVLVMVDSDMAPDMYVGHDPSAKPFFQSSFDFLYDRWDQGPHVVVAPYCGPPPHPLYGGESNVYVFKWVNYSPADDPDAPDFSLEGYTRFEAMHMSGIQECGAGPTGLVMYDMRAFDLTDPKHDVEQLKRRGLSDREIKALVTSWYEYEWTDIYHSGKGSTEDVVNLRDISLVGMQTLGYNPLVCNWDAWAGHWKPFLVGKPHAITVDQVNAKYRRAVQRDRRSDEKMRMLPMEQPAKKSGDYLATALDVLAKLKEAEAVQADIQAERVEPPKPVPKAPEKPTSDYVALPPDALARQAQYMAASEPKAKQEAKRQFVDLPPNGPFDHRGEDQPVIPRGYGIPVSP